jgi:hypothetical protein
MKRLKSVLFAAAAAVALAGGSSARANIDWAIDWSPSNSSVTMMGGTQIQFSNLGLLPQTTSTTNPTATFTASNLTLGSGPVPDSLGSGQNFQMQAKIVDANGQTQIAFLSGTLFGGIFKNSLGTVTSNITSNIGSVMPTQTLKFTEMDGSTNTYVVTLTSLAPPEVGATKGAIGASVTVTNTGGGGGGSPHDTPEPSTLALGGLGMMFTGLMGWLRRNRNAAVAG